MSKKIKGRKRHILTDTLGLLIAVIVHSAGIQDRDGAPYVLASIRKTHPWLRHVFADGGYAGPKLERALAKIGNWTIKVVKRSDTARHRDPEFLQNEQWRSANARIVRPRRQPE